MAVKYGLLYLAEVPINQLNCSLEVWGRRLNEGGYKGYINLWQENQRNLASRASELSKEPICLTKNPLSALVFKNERLVTQPSIQLGQGVFSYLLRVSSMSVGISVLSCIGHVNYRSGCVSIALAPLYLSLNGAVQRDFEI